MATIEASSSSTSEQQQKFDLQSDIILFDCMSSVVPISHYKAFSMLNMHVVLKQEANVTLPIDDIERRVGTFYDLKVLGEAKDVPPIIQSRKIEYFKLPADIIGQFEAKEEGTSGKAEKQKKKKKK
ncbi:predicted protein [Naegleria gruberi]|uniref:Predicted protein n=1 Tax=Naegleria gruberi TaxID=5762 RepID=D2V3U4_NAEGR|nr:uncharacterized protein NAEGRDRAFT_63491 [Naegleria gruberi]EFC48255.1 predicted protein [Naegleria gruberi]|eukprot:XP_002680999.1 predicted protein [Naegleria gruberi strain NEG-M]